MRASTCSEVPLLAMSTTGSNLHVVSHNSTYRYLLHGGKLHPQMSPIQGLDGSCITAAGFDHRVKHRAYAVAVKPGCEGSAELLLLRLLTSSGPREVKVR
jgi:hypothetical protein